MEIAFPKRPRERGPAPDWAALGLLALVLLGACSSLGGSVTRRRCASIGSRDGDRQ
jgi:hypothetical protein